VNTDFIEISDELFLKVGKMITERYGIKMSPEKKIMFQARLQPRLRALGLHSFEEYASRLLSENNTSAEFDLLADYISTNKTEFFREVDHFSFLFEKVLPEWTVKNKAAANLQFRGWSAGCSNGQEAYSMAIQIEEYNRVNNLSINYSIVATDISGKMLRQAKEAIYPMAQVENIPLDVKFRYFLKGKETQAMKVRVIKEIRDRIQVGYHNLMDEAYPFDEQFDVIFIRNTMIYFDAQTQFKVLVKLINRLKKGGYLLIGHSESLINLPLPIQSVAPSIYMKI
jgi:chemotaxis protein methyltransferase CheR